MNQLRAVAAGGFLQAACVRGADRESRGWEGARALRSSPRRRGARIFIVVLLLLVFAGSCATTRSFPYPACLYDTLGRYDRGSVLAERDSDDALLFKYADREKGDRGFQWVKPGDPRRIRPCREATLMDVDSPFERMTPEEGREVPS